MNTHLMTLLFLALQLLTAAAVAERMDTVEEPVLFEPEQLQDDFARLYAGLKIANADLYAFTEPDEFDAHYGQILQALNEPLSRFDAEMLFQRFASLAHQAHTRVESDYAGYFAYLSAGGVSFPFSIAVDREQFLVADNRSPVAAIKPGDRMLAIGGESVQALLPRFRARVSAESPEFAGVMMEIYLPLLVWLESGRRDVATVTVEHGDGSCGTYKLTPDGQEAEETESPEAPFSLAGRDARMLTDTVAYLRPGPFHSTGEGEGTYDLTRYSQFIDGAFAGFLEDGADHLILDFRDNPGGDNSFSDPLIAWFADRPFRFSSDFRVRVSPQSTAANQARLDTDPDAVNAVSGRYAALYEQHEDGDLVSFEIAEVPPREIPRFDGEVYVLVNRYSFSNAVSAAALIQDYGFGVLMGEATVDMATTYGAMEQFSLPHTGIVVSYPKALIIRPNGEKRPHPITPDVPLPSPRIRGARDVMLEAAMDYVEGAGDPVAAW